MKRIAIFASGSGTNAEKIIQHFKNSELAEVSLIVSNKKDAFVLKRAETIGIATKLIKGKKELASLEFAEFLQEEKIDLIVLAGFLMLIPTILIAYFPDRIINIHPALLPKYGGKGMYGNFVHQAVFDAKEKKTGITIHYVNAQYDEGTIIAQESCKLEVEDSVETISKKVRGLEHTYYPLIIEKLLQKI